MHLFHYDSDHFMDEHPSLKDSMASDTQEFSPLVEVKCPTHMLRKFGTGITNEFETTEVNVNSCYGSPCENQKDFPTVTEYDCAAYSKEGLTEYQQQKIIRRMFNAFDVQQKRYLDISRLKELCEYVGRSVRAETMDKMFAELCAGDGEVTFEQFWNWWINCPDTNITKKAFSLVSADFSVPYHQQQLKKCEEGEKFTPSYRIRYFFKDLETAYLRQVSPWHDIPLQVCDPLRTKPEHIPANRFNMICEIPKWTRAKFEIATDEPFNPIKQDIKNGVPRFYKHGDMMWNYGAFPQTWESTEVTFHDEYKGDNDPIDVVEIGMRQMRVGDVQPVKVLGALGMIDNGQMDWKIVCISVNDPVSRFVKDINDVPKFLPGCLDAMREWFRVYKICQGGIENKFVFDGEFKNKAFSLQIIKESHFMWKNLRKIKGTKNF
ncbi:unnamed protein product [Phytomonas sp. Hart1]|nr:unnamed protein product [Phytomonas sp. Hart1]|eukprot:CCW67668.1 unnamed protein product [Phytomonas sp. isolate Hart1]